MLHTYSCHLLLYFGKLFSLTISQNKSFCWMLGNIDFLTGFSIGCALVLPTQLGVRLIFFLCSFYEATPHSLFSHVQTGKSHLRWRGWSSWMLKSNFKIGSWLNEKNIVNTSKTVFVPLQYCWDFLGPMILFLHLKINGIVFEPVLTSINQFWVKKINKKYVFICS